MLPSFSQAFHNPVNRRDYVDHNHRTNISEENINENSQSNFKNFLGKVINKKFATNNIESPLLIKTNFTSQIDCDKSILLNNLLKTIQKISFTYNQLEITTKPNGAQIELIKSFDKLHDILEKCVAYEKFLNAHQYKFSSPAIHSRANNVVSANLPNTTAVKNFQEFLNFFHTPNDDDFDFEIVYQDECNSSPNNQAVYEAESLDEGDVFDNEPSFRNRHQENIFSKIDHHILDLSELENWLKNYELSLKKLINIDQKNLSDKQKIFNVLGISSTTVVAAKFVIDSVLPLIIKNENKEENLSDQTTYYSAAILSFIALATLAWNYKGSSDKKLALQNNLLVQLNETNCALNNYQLNLKRELF